MEESRYMDFLKSKMAIAKDAGFKVSPNDLNSGLLPHQKDIVAWAINGGRRAIFAKFGLGKTVMEVEFCRKVIDHEGGKALIILPLGVKQEQVQRTDPLRRVSRNYGYWAGIDTVFPERQHKS